MVTDMIYSIETIQSIIKPIAQKYGIPAVFLFGSYARGTATEDSDIDLLVDTTGTDIKSLLQLGALYCDLEEAFQKRIDLITIRSLEQKDVSPHSMRFRETINQERMPIYVAA